MTPSSLRRDIQEFIDLLIAKDIAIVANRMEERRGVRGIIRVTWSTPHGRHTGELFRGDTATIDGYCAWLDASAYSAVLYDGSLIQITYDVLGREVIGHRLAYLPCPFDVDENLLREEPLLDVIDYYRASEDEVVKLRSPLRFDYDPDNQSDAHPATHMTLLFSHCRWAVSAPLSLGHFVRFLFGNFYPHLWQQHAFLREWPQRPLMKKRTITQHEAAMLHVTWSDTASHLQR